MAAIGFALAATTQRGSRRGSDDVRCATEPALWDRSARRSSCDHQQVRTRADEGGFGFGRSGCEEDGVSLGRVVPVFEDVAEPSSDAFDADDLESYDTFASVDLLADHMVASMLAGLSGRRYHTALEPVGETVEQSASGTSQSSVSRRFVAATAERLAEFRSRPLDDQRCDVAGHTMVGALAVTADGTKVPLGVVEGSTENAAPVRPVVLKRRGGPAPNRRGVEGR
ncbi:MAG: hypothetical protein ACRD0U_01095 [Acidimicrobiales bacterium]